MSYWNLNEREKEQLAMYRQIKEAVEKGQIVSLSINENMDGIEIKVNLTKKEKKTIQILQNEANNDGYR
jgi:hypothetical protein